MNKKFPIKLDQKFAFPPKVLIEYWHKFTSKKESLPFNRSSLFASFKWIIESNHCLSKTFFLSSSIPFSFEAEEILLFTIGGEFYNSYTTAKNTQQVFEFFFLILFNCLIDTIYFTVSDFHLPTSRSYRKRLCYDMYIRSILTRSIIQQTFENTHTEWTDISRNLLTWMEKVIFRFYFAPFFCHFYFKSQISSVNCL